MRGKGFTLVELLVTISILAILMTIALISYGNIQKGARDAKRKSDISSIQAALEQYHADQGFYPASITTGSPISSGSATYMRSVPTGPNSDTYSYTAKPNSCSARNCINYCLYAIVENSSSTASASLCSSAPASTYQTQAP